MKCPACGAPVDGDTCPFCGTSMSAGDNRPPVPPPLPGPNVRVKQLLLAGAVVAVVAAGTVLAVTMAGRGGNPSPVPTTTQTIEVINAPTTVQPAYPAVTVPPGSKECSRTGTGPFAASGTANESTSCPFAINVREAYLKAGLNGAPGQIVAFSPTTGLTYTMDCAGAQPVLCRGGVAGRVVIYGGQLVTSG